MFGDDINHLLTDAIGRYYMREFEETVFHLGGRGRERGGTTFRNRLQEKTIDGEGFQMYYHNNNIKTLFSTNLNAACMINFCELKQLKLWDNAASSQLRSLFFKNEL